jgi:PKHD-type hydroxylase
MQSEYCIFKETFSPEYCDWIISEASKIPKIEPKLGVSGNTANQGIRSSKIAFLNKQMPVFQNLFESIWKVATIGNAVNFQFDLQGFDFIQFSEYTGEMQGQYKRHQDVFWLNKHPTLHRKLSIVIQLTDPSSYEGGDLELYDVTLEHSKDDFRKRGSMIIFPSFIYHAALPVTKGVRHSLAIWIDGPKWK